MPKYNVTVLVFPRRASPAPDIAFNRMMKTVGKTQGEILDPQGERVRRALEGLGFANITKVRIGKQYDLTVKARNKKAAHKMVERMCTQCLCNSTTEDFEIASVCKLD